MLAMPPTVDSLKKVLLKEETLASVTSTVNVIPNRNYSDRGRNYSYRDRSYSNLNRSAFVYLNLSLIIKTDPGYVANEDERTLIFYWIIYVVKAVDVETFFDLNQRPSKGRKRIRTLR
jgi:hypothetical protein